MNEQLNIKFVIVVLQTRALPFGKTVV